jgi:NitT/TauT family transport system substrate-binding protein
MGGRQTQHYSRREFLGGLTLVGTSGMLGLHPRPVAAEPPPETTTLKLTKVPSTCRAPQWVAEELLSAEGFTDVQYVKVLAGGKGADLTGSALVSGQVDLSMQFIGPSILQIDVGDPIVLLAGIQIGCFELFGTDRVRTIRDLKGKTVAAGPLGGSGHTFLASMAAYVGLDPPTDVSWVYSPDQEALQLFAEGRADALMASPPRAQEARARKLGHVIVSTVMDRPWSQYFCCLMAGHRDFVRRYPVATKRALRAILKATDICAREPERVARFLVDEGYAERYDYTLQALKEIPYNRWREYVPEDTVRFHALRLHEAGMIKTSPQKIIAQGTDWRFLNELKKELKG